MFGVFVEPDVKLKAKIQRLKKNLLKVSPNSKFVSHPPHCTLFFSKIKKQKIAIKKICKINIKKKIRIFCNNYSFFNTAVNENKKIFYIQIANNRKLLSLQLLISNELKQFVSREYIKKNKKIFINKSLHNSFVNYGFEFIGPHWIPHFTIGEVDINSLFFKKYYKQNLKYNFYIKYLSFWKVTRDKHVLLKKIQLY